MQLGVGGLNAKATLGPAETVRLARRAEELGYRSWWAGEHVVLPSPRVPPAPMEPTDPILDPLIHLAYVAAVTTELELGTGIVILPQRNPLVLAKQVASLDVLCSGRLRLGIGAGYLEPELAALGVAMSERGSRTDEYLDAMDALWTQSQPSYAGRHVTFDQIDAYPRPIGLQIVVGGHSPGAFRRAVSRGNGGQSAGAMPRTPAGQALANPGVRRVSPGPILLRAALAAGPPEPAVPTRKSTSQATPDTGQISPQLQQRGSQAGVVDTVYSAASKAIRASCWWNGSTLGSDTEPGQRLPGAAGQLRPGSVRSPAAPMMPLPIPSGAAGLDLGQPACRRGHAGSYRLAKDLFSAGQVAG
jgi:probable F420-dependent oxidoreductase